MPHAGMYGWHQGGARLTADLLRQGLPTWLSSTITSSGTAAPPEEVESEQSDGSDDSAPEEATLNPIAKLKRTYLQVGEGGVVHHN